MVTSGGDQVFPRGLPVGTIESVVPDPQHQPYTAITIKPAANLSQLEEVLVITGTSPTLPTQAQADAAQAEATAEENKRAAEVLAEKLPSVNDQAAGADQGATDPNAPGAAANGATAACSEQQRQADRHDRTESCRRSAGSAQLGTPQGEARAPS